MEREVLNTDHARVIRKAIAGLSANQRKVIELAYYEGSLANRDGRTDGRTTQHRKTWVRTG